MRSCEEYEELVSALIDGVLPEEDRGGLMEHMAGCPACQAYFDDQIAIHDALCRSLEEAPEGFSSGVMDLVRRTPQEKAKTVRLRSWRRWAALAACCAVVALGVWTLETAKKNETACQDSGGATPRCAMDSAAPENAYSGLQPEAAPADAGGAAEEDWPAGDEGGGTGQEDSLVQAASMPDLFAQIPERLDCPSQGAALFIEAGGAFSGTLADGTRFSGVLSGLEEAGPGVYSAAATSVSLEEAPEGVAFSLEEGAAVLICQPGADVKSLPEGFSGYEDQEPLLCWTVYFPAEEMAFTCPPA